nr:MAG TPA: hypothetical protein [Caudoviricetes sp.]
MKFHKITIYLIPTVTQYVSVAPIIGIINF